jgi:hypothetical protein
VLRHKLDRFTYDAGLAYGRLARKVLAAMVIPIAVGDGHRAADVTKEMTPEMVFHLRQELGHVERRMRGISRSGASAVRDLAVFEAEAADEQAAALVLAEMWTPG